ncbi:MAG TPA: response regulator FixJ [Arenibaculum sp.]|nr:response regulator FixJ [Arenibaculum sp.]
MTTEPTVFIVDDDEAVRDSLDMLLEASGFTVETFASPTDFLASDAPQRPGCLIVDIRMPEMSGLEVQEQLNQAGHTLPVIVITGHGDVPLAVRAMKSGAVDFVEKPFDEETILNAVRNALESMRPRGTPACPPELLSRLAVLTPREREVLEGLVAGRPNKVIAHDLSISPRTVEIHRARVMEKMRADSLPHLVRMAIEAGVVPNDA